MTVENTNNTISYTGNGSVTTFAYDFLVYQQDQITVYFDGVEQTVGYSVTDVGNQDGGDIVFITAPDDGVIVKIERIVEFTQEIVYQEYGPFPAKANERGLDLSVMRDLQILDDLNDARLLFDRTIHLQDEDETPKEDLLLDLPTLRANKWLGFDANGKVVSKTVNSAEGLSFTESKVLQAGQVEVTFEDVSSAASFYICGNNVDSGRLCGGVDGDYEVKNTTTITLSNSYPAGTVVLGIQNDISNNPSQGVISFNSRNGLVVSEDADYEASQVVFTSSEGLISTRVGGAIDELKILIDANSSSINQNQQNITQEALNKLVYNNQVSSTYDIQLSDEGKVVNMNNPAANTVNILDNTSQGFGVGSNVLVRQLGEGITTISATAGVTLNGVDGGSVELSKFLTYSIDQVTIDNWVLTGSSSVA